MLGNKKIMLLLEGYNKFVSFLLRMLWHKCQQSIQGFDSTIAKVYSSFYIYFNTNLNKKNSLNHDWNYQKTLLPIMYFNVLGLTTRFASGAMLLFGQKHL